jgi:CheY-like chemotaxis protein
LPTILIAEDNDDLRIMLSQFLGANGYRAVGAADGFEAVEAAVSERPDLIVMDLGMPGMDGLAAVAEIRRRSPADAPPVLIVSAYDRLEFRTEAVNAGCVGFITKPVDPAGLLETIRLLLQADGGDPPRTTDD